MAPTPRRVLACSSLVLLIACAAYQREGSGPEARADEPASPAKPSAKPTDAKPWSPPEQERELGEVRWRRDYDAARAEAKRRARPLFVLFDEVPGCATCTGFGSGPLSDPLVVDAIEAHYVPVLVRNNVGGREKEVLTRFGEPTWANPSARVVDPKDERTLVRLQRNYSTQGVLEAAAAGLRASKAAVPSWLALHLGSGKRAQATFGMACFWTGEVRLGGLPGVISTRTGWRGHSEVVEVEFDPERISRAQLEAKAKQMSCAQPFSPKAPLRATPQDDKYQIRRGPLRFLPLSPTQATRINARVGRKVDELLSPRQRRLLALIEAHPKADWPLVLGRPLGEAWAKSTAVAAGLAAK